MRQSLTVIYCAVSGREASSLAACGLQLGTCGEEFWAYKVLSELDLVTFNIALSQQIRG